MCHLDGYEPLIEFIQNEFDYYQFYSGPRQQLSEVALVPKAEILKYSLGREPHPIVNYGERIEKPKNLVELYVRSTALKRLIAQQGVLPLLGDQLWSPIGMYDEDTDALSEVEICAKILV